MKNLGIEFRVGLFTLLGLASTGYLFIALSPDLFNSKGVKIYHTYLDNAGGIVPKSHIKTNGVSIGKVKAVDLGVNNTKITLEIDEDILIPKGSKLSIKSVGLLGDSHIEIYRAADTGEFIEEGELIPQSTDGTDLSGLIDIAGSIAQDIKKITHNLSEVLGNDNGRVKMENIVDNIEAVTDEARQILEENRKNVRDLVANFKEVSASLNNILDEDNKEKLDRIIAAFDDSMAEVRSATKNINLISQRIEKGEGTLGKLVNDDVVLTELEGAIKDIREVLAPATKLEIAVDSHIEARHDESTQTYFNLVFRTRPDRYYILGFSDTEDEVVEEKIQNNDQICQDEEEECNTATTTTRQTEKALKFNLQFAKRWGAFALRFGLFESSGGFGSDLFLFRDRLRFTVEAWDWKTKQNDIRRVAHLKAYTSILFFDHIYLMAGVDDPTKYEERGDSSKYQKTNYFFGAGITFNDQDLKALFGAAALSSAM